MLSLSLYGHAVGKISIFRCRLDDRFPVHSPVSLVVLLLKTEILPTWLLNIISLVILMSTLFFLAPEEACVIRPHKKPSQMRQGLHRQRSPFLLRSRKAKMTAHSKDYQEPYNQSNKERYWRFGVTVVSKILTGGDGRMWWNGCHQCLIIWRRWFPSQIPPWTEYCRNPLTNLLQEEFFQESIAESQEDHAAVISAEARNRCCDDKRMWNGCHNIATL
jgi:hypothetical protein